MEYKTLDWLIASKVKCMLPGIWRQNQEGSPEEHSALPQSLPWSAVQASVAPALAATDKKLTHEANQVCGHV